MNAYRWMLPNAYRRTCVRKHSDDQLSSGYLLCAEHFTWTSTWTLTDQQSTWTSPSCSICIQCSSGQGYCMALELSSLTDFWSLSLIILSAIIVYLNHRHLRSASLLNQRLVLWTILDFATFLNLVLNHRRTPINELQTVNSNQWTPIIEPVRECMTFDDPTSCSKLIIAITLQPNARVIVSSLVRFFQSAKTNSQ